MVGIGPRGKQERGSPITVPDINRDFGEASGKVGSMAVKAIGKPKVYIVIEDNDRRERHTSLECLGVFGNGGLSLTFRPSFLSRSYQRPEDGLGSDEAESLVER